MSADVVSKLHDDNMFVTYVDRLHKMLAAVLVTANSVGTDIQQLPQRLRVFLQLSPSEFFATGRVGSVNRPRLLFRSIFMPFANLSVRSALRESPGERQERLAAISSALLSVMHWYGTTEKNDRARQMELVRLLYCQVRDAGWHCPPN